MTETSQPRPDDAVPPTEPQDDAVPPTEPPGDAVPPTEPPGDAVPLTEPPGDAVPLTESPDDVVPLTEPRDGLPEVVTTGEALDRATASLARGSGPVAVDAERASGFRYGQRAFLVQFRREGAGTVLIDPVACPDLSELDAALAPAEVVLHAAGQDLPCLAELGYRPRALFDTELAGRLLGFPRVGLAALVEEVLGLRLAKGHGAEDWSTRPLPAGWLRYAALDVEVLVELRDALAQQLEEQGKTEWARQEFAAVLAAKPPGPRTESVAAHLRHSPGPHAPRPGRRPRAVAGAGHDSQGPGFCHPGGCCPIPPSSRPPACFRRRGTS